MLRNCCAWFVALLFACGATFAAEQSPSVAQKGRANPLTLLGRTVVDVPIEECARRDICDLKRLVFVTEDYRLQVGRDDYQYFTLMYATYETSTFATLEKYAFVQFIRGTVFTSRKDPETGKTEVTYDSALGNFGQWVVYRIPDWIIDSGSRSPIYMSIEGMPRHYWYRWQKEVLTPPWITEDENLYCGANPTPEHLKNNPECRKRPSAPRLYVDDNPQEAFFANGTAYNVSLEFKTCLYKSADIPATTTRHDTNFAEPLYCFPWRSSYVYNHDTKKFESPPALVFPGLTGPNELIIIGDRVPRKPEQE